MRGFAARTEPRRPPVCTQCAGPRQTPRAACSGPRQPGWPRAGRREVSPAGKMELATRSQVRVSPSPGPGCFQHAPPALPVHAEGRVPELRSCRRARGSPRHHPGSAGLAPAAAAQVGMPIPELQAGSAALGDPGGARVGGQRALSPLPPSSPELAPEIRKIK